MADVKYETEISVVIDGEEKTLVPSYGAAKAISTKYGGTMAATSEVASLNINTIVEILSLGLGHIPPNKPPADLAERIWKTGLTDDTGGLAMICIRYLRLLGSGGRIPESGEAHQDSVDPLRSS